jgi:RNA polymerase sigma factor (TIGR02999 family)
MPITELLQKIHAGDQQAIHDVIPLVYGELKALAAGHLRREAGGTPLETTALVHEAFLRLAGHPLSSCENRSHFFGIASRLMRQILVDQARAKAADKRSAMTEVQLSGLAELGRGPDESVLAINDALDELAQVSVLKAQLIEMRYFGGMTAEESATAMSMSVHVVRRELRLAQAWLKKEMSM